jgi:hypothetical protein
MPNKKIKFNIKPGTLVSLAPVIEPFGPVVGLVMGPDILGSEHIPSYIVLAEGKEYSLPESLLDKIIAEPTPAENFTQ